MFDTKLRKQIGAKIKQRRLELNLPMQYVADRLGVNKSTVQRYESGAIDNTKKLVLEGIGNVLHVSPEWLLGETDVIDTEVTDALEIKIGDSYRRILSLFPPKLNSLESEFAKTLLLFLLESYEELIPRFENASVKYSETNDYGQIPQEIGFESNDEFRHVMYLREIMQSANNFKDAGEILSQYPKEPQMAMNRLKNLLRLLPAENRR